MEERDRHLQELNATLMAKQRQLEEREQQHQEARREHAVLKNRWSGSQQLQHVLNDFSIRDFDDWTHVQS